MFELAGDISRMLVMGHVAPDGDSVSSALAFAKRYKGRFFAEQGLSPTLAWLVDESGVELYDLKKAQTWKPTLLAVVDCAPTRERTGFPIEGYLNDHPEVRVVNIDHHADRVGERPWTFDSRVRKYIFPECSSTAEIMVNEGFRDGFLYAGLATDTVFFKYSHPDRAMAAVLKLGLTDEQVVRYRDLLDIHLDYRQLCVLFDADMKYVDFPSVDRNLLVVRLPVSDTDVNMTSLNLTRGFDFVAVVQPSGRASLRTRCDVDLSVFARKFDGGGHAKAAGCMVKDIDAFTAAFGDFIMDVGVRGVPQGPSQNIKNEKP